jgi:hypothetical protein
MPAVAEVVQEFLSWYSSIHRGAVYKSRRATAALRTGQSGCPFLRRAVSRGRGCGDHLPQYDRGHQSPRLSASAGTR